MDESSGYELPGDVPASASPWHSRPLLMLQFTTYCLAQHHLPRR